MRNFFAAMTFAVAALGLSELGSTGPRLQAQTTPTAIVATCDGSSPKSVKCPLSTGYKESFNCDSYPTMGVCPSVTAYNVASFDCYPIGNNKYTDEEGVDYYITLCLDDSWAAECSISRTCFPVDFELPSHEIIKVCSPSLPRVEYRTVKKVIVAPDCQKRLVIAIPLD